MYKQGCAVDYIHIVNWRKFQHYRKRKPPWIKLYVDVLDDFEYYSLPDNQKLILIHLWLLASKTDNNIPYNHNWIKATMKLNIAIEIEPLIQAGFVWSDDVKIGDSKMLSSCYQDAIPETETEKRRCIFQKPKKCHRTGCNKMGTTWDTDDTGLRYWMCDEHKKVKQVIN